MLLKRSGENGVATCANSAHALFSRAEPPTETPCFSVPIEIGTSCRNSPDVIKVSGGGKKSSASISTFTLHIASVSDSS